MIKSEEVEIRWKSPGIRSIKNSGAKIAGIAIFALMLVILGSILEYVSAGGISHISWQVITGKNPFQGGGIGSAILGTWMLVGVGLMFSVPPGILGSLYLVKSTTTGRVPSVMKLFTDILTSVPSIVVGLFGYLVLVVEFGWGFSLLAGGFALSVMMLPYVLRVSELSMKSVPKEQVQNAYALGADDIQVAGRIYMPQALSGILSGIILSISIAAGETAQLLYTAEWSGVLPGGFLNSSVGYLTYVVYTGLNFTTQAAHNLAFVAAFVLIVMLLGLTLLAKVMDRLIPVVSTQFRKAGNWFVRVFK